MDLVFFLLMHYDRQMIFQVCQLNYCYELPTLNKVALLYFLKDSVFKNEHTKVYGAVLRSLEKL